MLNKISLRYPGGSCILNISEGTAQINRAEVSPKIAPQGWILLEGILSSPNGTLSYDDIYELLWHEDAEYYDRKVMQNVVRRLNSAFKELCGIKILTCSATQRAYHISRDITWQQSQETPPAVLPPVLTRTSVVFEDEETVLHRSREISRYLKILSGEKTAVVFTGFGGMGKTTLARVLYHKLADRFDSVGWVEYHRNLRESILTSFVLCEEEADAGLRWKSISTAMNGRERKLLVVDNVDLNELQQQYPQRDSYLQQVSGWQNTTVILTSRYEEIQGFRSCPVKPLGNEQHPEPCIDLFYFYYDRAELEKPPAERRQVSAVRQLVRLAHYHTYVIELLARSARYENDLADYARRIEAKGFGAPTLSVESGRSRGKTTAAEQLRILFDPASRPAQEQKILWDFSVLPESISLSPEETRRLLGYSENDLDSLCQEDWLKFQPGQGFSLHPLIREVILSRLQGGKAPAGTAQKLIDSIAHRELSSVNLSHSEVLRLIWIAESASHYLTFSRLPLAVSFFWCLSQYAFEDARQGVTASLCMAQAVRYLERIGVDADELAYAFYRLGYLESTTREYRQQAREDLRRAWALLSPDEDRERDKRSWVKIGQVGDHLGYVLSDIPDCYPEAEARLRQALKIRKALFEQDSCLNFHRDYACTCDNLGCLLLRMDPQSREARELLEQAEQIRSSLARRVAPDNLYWIPIRDWLSLLEDGAWTSFNLGLLYMQQANPGAERCFRQTLEFRRELEEDYPGKYTAGIVRAMVKLALLLNQKREQHQEELPLLIREAAELWQSIGPVHDEFFADEVEADFRALGFQTESQNLRLSRRLDETL